MMVGKIFSVWDGTFSGAMLTFKGVNFTKQTIESLGKANLSMTLSDWKDIRNFEVSKKMPHNRFVATVKRMKGSF